MKLEAVMTSVSTLTGQVRNTEGSHHRPRSSRSPAAAGCQRAQRAVRSPGVEDDPVLGGDRYRRAISPAELTFMATRAGARITDVNAGHLSRSPTAAS